MSRLPFGLRYPVGQHIHHLVRLRRVIGDEMNCKVVFPIHAFVHHEDR